MKRYLVAIFSFTILLTACKKKAEPAFDQTPDQRLATVMNAFQDKLVKQTDGWKVLVCGCWERREGGLAGTSMCSRG